MSVYVYVCKLVAICNDLNALFIDTHYMLCYMIAMHVLQEHKSEAGRTPLMKASRAGHLETVQFLVEKGIH